MRTPDELDRAPELVRYQDQPTQQPAGAPGKDAYLRMGFERRGERTELVDLERRTPLLVQQALYFDEGMPNLPCVYIVSTGGGVLQGDRMAIEIRLAKDAQAWVSTQSATKLHEMDANYALQTQDIVLEERAYLEYLPEVTIPYRGSRFLSRSRLFIAPTATLLYAESVMPGRKYYKDGERFAYDVFSARVDGRRPDGQELFVEKLLVEPAEQNVRQTGVMGRFDVFANVILLTPKDKAEAIFSDTSPVVDLDAEHGVIAAVSRLPNDAGLIFKVVGVESEVVRDTVRTFWSRARRVVTGCEVPPPFAWR